MNQHIDSEDFDSRQIQVRRTWRGSVAAYAKSIKIFVPMWRQLVGCALPWLFLDFYFYGQALYSAKVLSMIGFSDFQEVRVVATPAIQITN
jgi:hypothetical protein